MFTIQDDTGTVENANAYTDEAFVRAYWTDRGVDLSAKSDAEIEALIIQASNYIDIRYTYKGAPLAGRDQTTAFPREYLYDAQGYLVEGVPREVKAACAEYANAAISGSLTTNTVASASNLIEKRTKVGPIEKAEKYSEGSSGGSSANFAVYQSADRLLTLSGFTVKIYTPIRG